MFRTRKQTTLDVKVLEKRINRQLVANFFTIQEFKELTERQAYKVIKLISKIEGIALTKKEIKEVVLFIQSDFDVQMIGGTIKLWDFVVNYITNKKEVEIKEFSFENQFELESYRKDRFDLLRM